MAWRGNGVVISNGYRRAVLHEDETDRSRPGDRREGLSRDLRFQNCSGDEQVQDWWLGFDG